MEVDKIEVTQKLLTELNNARDSFPHMEMNRDLTLEDQITIAGDYSFEILMNNEKVGFVTLFESVIVGYFQFDILIFEEYRGKGIFKTAYNLLENWSINKTDFEGLEAVVFKSNVKNLAAMKSVLLKNGFSEEDQNDRLVYSKTLTPSEIFNKFYIIEGEKIMPSLNQLKHTIAAGNDSQDNRLILLSNGDFKLVPYNNANDAVIFENLDYVTRWETLDSGNDWVGPDAAKDEKWMNQILEWANEAWDIHQKTGKKKILNPYA